MTRYNLQNLYLAKIKEKYLLSKKGSIKESYHIIFDTKNTVINFNPGDCLGVLPENDPTIVLNCLKNMNAEDKKSIIIDRFSKTYSLIDFLTKHANISRVQSKILRIFLEKTTDPKKKEKLSFLLLKENKEHLTQYLQNNELVDILEEFYCDGVMPEEVCSSVLPLMPRLYSISSSKKAYPDELHLTVTNVTYTTSNKKRYGVCSHFLCDLAKDNIRSYIHPSHRFFLPSDNTKDIIMFSAGSGIAPFRSFIQERYVTKAAGKNWLFFGECNKATNYYYEDYFEKLKKENFLDLSLAFSRDQEEKIYVQHLLLKEKDKFWKWFEKGAYIYVCGSAKALAKGVDSSLIQIFMEKMHLNDEKAHEFLTKLIQEKRYLKDVY